MKTMSNVKIQMTREVQSSNVKRGMLALVLLFLSTGILFAKDEGGPTLQGDQLYNSGSYEAAAKWYVDFINQNPKDSKATPRALIMLGQSLDKMSDIINTKAERECFRSPKGSRGTPCMNEFAANLNKIYGAGSFEYAENLVIIKYTGAHFKRASEEFSKSDLGPEAAYLVLTKNLIGHPDIVLPKIKAYMEKYKGGEWGRRGRLLWARINEDVWWVHRKWSWVLYNWSISPEELIVKAEPYRQEALKSFEDLYKKDGKTEEGQAAKREYDLLKNYQDDGKIYGIINESNIEGVRGSTQP